MTGLYPDAPKAADVPFTDSARQLLAGAGAEAERLGHEFIGTEHVALAMTQDAEALALLRQLGVDGERARTAIEGIVRTGRAALPPGAERPYTSRTRQAFGLAAESARAHGSAAVGTGHLLVGLLRERKHIGAQVLQEQGLSAERAAAAMQRPGGSEDTERS
jgi:ATP-dependent Clp protease ATP-binding subunit ClpC